MRGVSASVVASTSLTSPSGDLIKMVSMLSSFPAGIALLHQRCLNFEIVEGQGRPYRVELGKRAAEIVCVDAVLVTGLPLCSQFRQAVFRGFDLLLNADNPDRKST